MRLVNDDVRIPTEQLPNERRQAAVLLFVGRRDEVAVHLVGRLEDGRGGRARADRDDHLTGDADPRLDVVGAYFESRRRFRDGPVRCSLLDSLSI